MTQPSIRKVAFAFPAASGTGWMALPLTASGRFGKVERVVVRMATTGSPVGVTCDLVLANGSYSTVSDGSTVPDEDVVLAHSAIAMVASATAASVDDALDANVGHYSSLGAGGLFLMLNVSAISSGAATVSGCLYISDCA